MRKILLPPKQPFYVSLLALAILCFPVKDAKSQCGIALFPGNIYTPNTNWQATQATGSGTYQRFNVTSGNIYSFAFSSPTTNLGYDWDMTLSSNSAIISYNDINTPIPNSYSGGIGCSFTPRPSSAVWYSTFSGLIEININTWTGSICEQNVSGQDSATLNYRECAPLADPGAGTGGNWNVEAFATTALAIPNFHTRWGYYLDSVSGLEFNTRNYWSSDSVPSSASTWSGCTVSPENFTIRARRQGFACGLYKFQIDSAQDSIGIYINGSAIYSGYDAINVTAGNPAGYTLSVNDIVEIRLTAVCSGNYADITIAPLTVSPVNGGTIQDSVSTGYVCGGAPLGSFLNVDSATGGAGNLTYQWQGSVNDSAYRTIAVSTPSWHCANTLPPGDTVVSIRRVATDKCGNQGYSNIITITGPPIANAGANDTICNGSTVVIGGSPTATGGVSPYTYLWSPGASLSSADSANPNASPATSTMYCVTVSDANACSASACEAVVVNPAIIACAGPNGGFNMTDCPGSNVQLGCSPTALGGSGNYGYSWSPDTVNGVQVLNSTTASNPIVSGLATSTVFTVTVTDNVTGCSTTAQVNVTVNPSTLSANAGTSGFTICDSGSATIGGNPTASGGQPPYSYAWNNGLASVANPSASPASTTAYTVTVTDHNNCSSSATTTVVVNTAPAITSTSGSNPTTCGGINGSITLNGLTSDSTYSITYFLNGVSQGPVGLTANGSGQVIITGLNAGAYTEIAASLSGCPSAATSGTITLSNPSTPPAPATTANPNPVCSGDSITLSASGTAGAAYSWTGPSGYTSIIQDPTITNAASTNAGSYCATQTVANCTSPQACVTVTVNTPSTAATGITVTNNPVCNGSSTTLSVVGGSLGTGANWAWYSGSCGGTLIGTGPSVLVSPTTTTIYYVRAESSCGNSACFNTTVFVNQPPNGSISGTTSVCSGDSANITFNFTTGTAPFRITYTDGINSFTVDSIYSGYNILVGNINSTVSYTLTSITDSNTCSRTLGFLGGATITFTPLPLIPSVVATATLCNGNSTGTIIITASSGTPPYRYSIDSGLIFQGNNIFAGLPIDSYYVTVKDTQGCGATYGGNPVVVTQPTALSISDSAVNAICNTVDNGQLIIHASGATPPYEYSLNGGPAQPGNVFAGLSAAVDTVTVTDQNGCSITSADTVMASPVTIVFDSATVVPDSCGFNGSINVSVSGGAGPLSYSWSNTGTGNSIVQLAAGWYTLTITDSIGCQLVLHYEVGVQPCDTSGSALVLYGIAYNDSVGRPNFSPGSLFSFGPVINSYANVHNFGSAGDGKFPTLLYQTINGNFYGTTSAGENALYEYDPGTGLESSCLDFDSLNTIFIRNYDMAEAYNSMLYGVTDTGGANGAGFVFMRDTGAGACVKVLDLTNSSGALPGPYLLAVPNGKLMGVMQRGGANGYGNIYSYNPANNVYANVFNFDGTGGPGKLLVAGKNGQLYGVTDSGSFGSGALFTFNPITNVYQRLYSFSDTSGYGPDGMIQVSNGNIVGITHAGGSVVAGLGTIFKYNTATQVFTTLFDFSDSTGRGLSSNLIQTSNGNICGITHAGGSVIAGIVFSYNIFTNVFTPLQRLNDTMGYGAAYSNSAYIMQASDGNIYGVLHDGGNNGSGAIFSYNFNNSTFTKLYDFEHTSAGNPIMIAQRLNRAGGNASVTVTMNNFNMRLYPDPVTDRLIVESAEFYSVNPLVTVTDITGKKVKVNYQVNSSAINLNTSVLAAGMYIVTVNLRGENASGRFVKE